MTRVKTIQCRWCHLEISELERTELHEDGQIKYECRDTIQCAHRRSDQVPQKPSQSITQESILQSKIVLENQIIDDPFI